MTAIGVMARVPLPGRCKTRLLGAFEPVWVSELYAAMLGDTLSAMEHAAANTQIVFVAPLEDGPSALERMAAHLPSNWEGMLQEGADLGARIEHALAALLERGGPAVLVGSDCPLLPTDEIRRIGELANAVDVTIGPSADGGYYLIAMRRIEPRLLRDVPWSSARVLEVTRSRAESLGLVVGELSPGYDIDEPGDVARLTADLEAAPERAPRTARHLRAR
jgi:uncharacterized protein